MPSDPQQFKCNVPAPDQALSDLVTATEQTPLPPDYLAFLRRANGGEGFLGETYASLWRAEDFVQSNLDYLTDPTLFIIGSNGGGEELAFDQSLTGSQVFSVPFIGLEYDEALKVSGGFDSFIQIALD